ncbi:hypothetical protein BGLA2_700129 [Burkholderia gladioli]|nr:hypothetical protein BGLA2_700129 [Burkholderia gladioli]
MSPLWFAPHNIASLLRHFLWT